MWMLKERQPRVLLSFHPHYYDGGVIDGWNLAGKGTWLNHLKALEFWASGYYG